MLIKLDNHYAKYTNNISDHDISCESVYQGLTVLFARYPQLYVHMLEHYEGVAGKSGLKLNGEYIIEQEVVHTTVVTEQDLLELGLLPTGEDKKTLRFMVNLGNVIGGIVLFVVSSFVPAMYGWGHGLAVGMMMDGINGLSGGNSFTMAMFSLMGLGPDIPDRFLSSISNSATYTFDGVRNTTASGTSIPIIYGTHRMGGQVLNMYTEVSEASAEVQTISGVDVLSSQTHLYAQIGLCEGEIESMTDVQINKLPLDFYNEIESAPSERFVRVGTETQTPMADFTQVQNTVTITRKVLNLQGQTLQSIPVTYSSYLPVYGQPRWESPGYTLGNYALAVQYYEESGG